jgi:pyruvate dehydrogenase E2 component (dihydrolipoamide acetyltransferase)
MKSRTIPALALGLIGFAFFFGLVRLGRPQAPQSKPDYLNAQLPVERRVAELLSRMTLSCDHRVLDGATATNFLQSLKKILKNPVYLAF